MRFRSKASGGEAPQCASCDTRRAVEPRAAGAALRIVRRAAMLVIAWLAVVGAAHAQYGPEVPYTPSEFEAPISIGNWPGHAWVAFNYSDRGLGFDGSYMTAGILTDTFEDNFYGRWFLDFRGHVSERGGFFSNLGIGRRQHRRDSVHGFTFWWDYDGDELPGFGHTFNQLGVTLEALHQWWSMSMNAYFPVGRDSFVIGRPGDRFVGNNVLIRNGFDVAFRGVDVEVGGAVPGLETWNGWMYGGFYWFESDVVDGFAGGRVRLEVSPWRQVAAHFQVGHDKEFGTTSLLGVTLFLAGGRHQCASTRYYQPTRRNDHIVRKNQGAILATNPDTGVLWRVIHVNNTAPAGGDGSFERPFNNLAAAQAASQPDDIIFVHRGDGTTTGLNTGITLQARQKFFGDGIRHTIDTVEVGPFDIFIRADGSSPRLTNLLGPVVVLSDDNEVSNFTLVSPFDGIVGTNINNSEIRNIFASNVVNDVIRLAGVTGTHAMDNINVNDAGGHGVNLINNNAQIQITGSDFDDIDPTGVGAGVNIVQNTGASIVLVDDTVLDDSAFGVRAQVNTVNAFLLLQVSNSNITDHGIAGVGLTATDGATLLAIIDGNQIRRNGGGTLNPPLARGGITIEGTGLGANTTAVLVSILDNDMTSNQALAINRGAQVDAFFLQNVVSDVLIDNNSMSNFFGFGPAADAMNFRYQTNAGLPQFLTVTNNVVTNHAQSSLDILLLDDSELGNNTLDVVGLVVQNNQFQFNGAAAVQLETGATVGVHNAQLRGIFSNNVHQNSANGFAVISRSATSIGLTVENSQFNTNTADGFNGQSFNTSTQVVQIVNSTFNGHTQQAIDVDAFNASTYFLSIDGNLFAASGNPEVTVNSVNTALVRTRLINGNVATNGYTMVEGAGSTHEFEEDGTNVGTITLGAGVATVPLGTWAATAPFLPP